MKINAIELFHIAIPFAVPYKLSKAYGTLTDAHAVIVKLRTDGGLTGWGEADPLNPFTQETPATVMAVIRDLIAPRLIGADPTQIGRIESELDACIHGNRLARGAIDMALFDLLGKAHNLPAHAFLGGKIHDRLPLLGAIGSGCPEDDARAIDTLIEQGYATVMIKMGALPIDQEIERMVAASRRFGDQMTFIVDANQGWQFKEAQTFIHNIAGHAPALIEQPIARHCIDELSHLRHQADSLLSVDESLESALDALAILRANAADVFSIKVSKNGGLRAGKSIAELAAAAGVRILMNSMLEFGITQAASLQLGCTLPNLLDCGHAYMSVLRMSDDITDFDQNISRALVTVPDRPGLGVAVDEDKLQRHTVEKMVKGEG